MKKILVLSGGGSRIIATCQYLVLLDEYLRSKGTNILDYFDMFAGNSAGSLVVGAIVYANTKGIDLLKDVFTEENLKIIMPHSKIINTIRELEDKSKYDGVGKTKVINKYCGDKSINESLGKHVLIPAYQVSGKKGPRLFTSWNDTCKISEVCDASSSAPVYFPSSDVYNSTTYFRYCDGGIFANDPSLCAYIEAIKLYGSNEDIRILSVGTGTFNNSQDVEKDWGLENWVIKGDILNAFLSGAEEINVLNMKVLTDTLNHKYLKINGPIEDESIDNISKENIESLKKKGIEWFNKNDIEELFKENSLFNKFTSIFKY